jgi:flap endonuclease-1
MGVKGLFPLLKRFAPNSITSLTLANLPREKGGVYALDVSGFLYASQYNAEHKGANSHLRLFEQLLAQFQANGLTCIPVFDGNTKSEAKQATLDDRHAKITGQKERILTCLGLEPETAAEYSTVDLKNMALSRLSALPPEQALDLKQELRNFIAIPSAYYTDLKTLFQARGVAFRQATGEADFVCAELSRSGLIDGVCSEDMDMLTHGICRLVRGLTAGNRPLTVIDIGLVLTDLKFTLRQFQEWCILCGCDYCPKIPRIGGVKSLKLLEKWGSIATILEKETGLSVPPDFQAKYVKALVIFTTEN